MCKQCGLQYVLQGLRDESTLVHEHAFQTGTAMIREFGGGNADAFVFPLADAVLCFDHQHRLNSLSPKAMCIALFRQLVERVSEYRKYGTDMMSMDCCSFRTRLAFVTLLQICRLDADPEVRRQSNKVLAEQLQSVPKTKKETLGYLLATLRAIITNSENTATPNAAKVQAANRCLNDLRENAKDYDFSDEKYEAADTAQHNALRSFDWTIQKCDSRLKLALEGKHLRVCGAHHHTAKKVEDEDLSPSSKQKVSHVADDEEDETEWKELADLTKKGFADALTPLQQTILACYVQEHPTAQRALESGATADLQLLGCGAGVVEAAKLHEKVYKNYHPKELKQLENPEEVLCHVENLMLMYGGGHMLLKDTTFELRKGKRYGVVGRNGTGKTTLMNLIASGGVPGIPKTMTCIHVKPEVLDKQLNTKCKKFMEQENPDHSMAELEATLQKVMFPEDLWDVTIGELSGGWRMRLLIAGAMMKKADVLLLDEPTYALQKYRTSINRNTNFSRRKNGICNADFARKQDLSCKTAIHTTTLLLHRIRPITWTSRRSTGSATTWSRWTSPPSW